jgi:hypothetical protein
LYGPLFTLRYHQYYKRQHLRDCCKPLAVLGAGASAAKLCSTCYPSAKQSLLSWTPLIHLKGRCGCTTSLSLRYMVVKLQSIVSCMTVSHFPRLVIQRILVVKEHMLVGLQLARLFTALAQLRITWHVFDMSGHWWSRSTMFLVMITCHALVCVKHLLNCLFEMIERAAQWQHVCGDSQYTASSMKPAVCMKTYKKLMIY